MQSVKPGFEEHLAQIRAANTKVCPVCGSLFVRKEEGPCSGCAGLLESGDTALVDSQNRFAFVRFSEDSENSHLRGRVVSVHSRVMDTVLAKAADNEAPQSS